MPQVSISGGPHGGLVANLMVRLRQIACKNCDTLFYCSETPDALTSLGPEVRCPKCRQLHAREMRAIAVSHRRVRQFASEGTGGLTRFVRPPKPSEVLNPQAPGIEPLPIEEIIGDECTSGKLLHNLVHRVKQVTVVVGPTGSGKSTWLPYRLLQCQELLRDGPICITQPRIPATEKLTKRIAELHYGDEGLIGPGLDIGYRHSEVGNDKTDRHNKLVLMTDGSLLNEIMSGAIRRYSVVLIDEAHERSVNIDLILNLLRHRLPLFPNLRLIIASATVDADRFVNFFGGPESVCLLEAKGFTYEILEVWGDEAVASYGPPENWEKIAASAMALAPEIRYEPIFEAIIHRGPLSTSTREQLLRLAPGDEDLRLALDELSEEMEQPLQLIDTNRQIKHAAWLPIPDPPWLVLSEGVSTLIEATVEKVIRLCRRDENERLRRMARWERRPPERHSQPKPKNRGDILVFLHGTEAIEEVCRRLRERLAATPNRILPFYKDLPEHERNMVLYPSAEWKDDRLIVVSTNLAETSLTLDGLIYVVETGVIKQDYWDSGNKETRLSNILHSQAGCRQRIGRVGRREPGEAHRLYTREQLERFHPPHTTPAIQRSCAEEMVMKLSAAGVNQVEKFRWLDAPPKVELSRSEATLRQGGWVDDDGDLTSKGDELWRLSVDQPIHARLLLEADRFCCLPEAATFLSFTQRLRRGAASLWRSTAVDNNEHHTAPTLLALHACDLLSREEIRRSLLSQSVDDADLYLRIWSGWEGAPDSESWSRSFGLSNDALKEVEAARQKMLEPFSDKRKSSTVRRLFVERLPMLRLLAARVFRDWIYLLRPGSGLEPWRTEGDPDDAPQVTDFHPESVASIWEDVNNAAPVQPPAALVSLSNRPVRLSLLRGFAERNLRGYGRELRHVLRLEPQWLDAIDGDDATLALLASHSDRLAEAEIRPFELGSMPPLLPVSAHPGPSEDELRAFKEAHNDASLPVNLTIENISSLTDGAWIWTVRDQVTQISFPLADSEATEGFLPHHLLEEFISNNYPPGSHISLKVAEDLKGRWRVRRSFGDHVTALPAVVVQSDGEGSTCYLGFALGRLAQPFLTVGKELTVVALCENPEGHLNLRFSDDYDPWETIKSRYPSGTAARLPVVAISEHRVWVSIGEITSYINAGELTSNSPQNLAVGELINVVIKRYDERGRRVLLTPVNDAWKYEDVWQQASITLAPGSVHYGRLIQWLGHGGILELDHGIRAWLPSDEVEETTLNSITDTLAPRALIEVLVKNIDPRLRKLVVSQKALSRTRLEAKYAAGSTVSAVVSEVRSTGNIIAILEDGQAIFMATEGRYKDEVRPGDTITATVLGVAKSGLSLLGTLEDVTSHYRQSPPHGRVETFYEPTVHPSDQRKKFLRLDGEGGFQRVYYDDVLLGRSELRGARPAEQVRLLSKAGVRFNFREGGITVGVLEGSPSVLLNGTPLIEGCPAPLALHTNNLTIGQISLRATVCDLDADLAAESDDSDEDVYLHLEAEGNWSRVYYRDVTLGRNELRGVQSLEDLECFEGTGVRFSFDRGRVRLSVLPGLPEIILDDLHVKPGERAYLPLGRSVLHIGRLRLRATVARVLDEVAP